MNVETKDTVRMITMRLEDVVIAFVEQLLPRGSDRQRLLQMSFEIRAQKPEGGKEIRYYLHLLFHRPNNYTKVLWNMTNEMKKTPRDFTKWQVKCDHDSGWRTDGLSSPLFNLGFEMVKKIDRNLRPCDCEVLARFTLCGEPKTVTIKDYQYDSEAGKFNIEW